MQQPPVRQSEVLPSEAVKLCTLLARIIYHSLHDQESCLSVFLATSTKIPGLEVE